MELKKVMIGGRISAEVDAKIRQYATEHKCNISSVIEEGANALIEGQKETVYIDRPLDGYTIDTKKWPMRYFSFVYELADKLNVTYEEALIECVKKCIAAYGVADAEYVEEAQKILTENK